MKKQDLVKFKAEQADIDTIRSMEETMRQEGMAKFNNKSNPEDVIDEGMALIKTADKLLHRLCDMQHDLNLKFIQKHKQI